MDHVSKNVRSRIMASVRSRGNTTTELPLGRFLWNAGFKGYRKHWPVAGKPDFSWPGRKNSHFCGRVFLAWLRLQVFTANEHGILARQDRGE